MKYKIYTDGGSRNNPGESGSAFVIYVDDKIICRGYNYLGIQTNNYAEYMAVKKALEYCIKKKLSKIKIYTDSNLVFQQLKGKWAVKSDNIKQLYKECKELESQLDRVKYKKVKGHSDNEGNNEADRLVNVAIDKKKDKLKESKSISKYLPVEDSDDDFPNIDYNLDDYEEEYDYPIANNTKVIDCNDTMDDVLTNVFGFSSFRPVQGDIVKCAVETQKDILAIMPTGGGKSLCFQLPAIMASTVAKTTLVVSPLRSLIKDQVDAMKKKGISVELITGENTGIKNLETLNNIGDICLVYITPEILSSNQTLLLAKRDRIARLVIDEAHCLSSWGHDFRPAYRWLERFRDLLPEIPITALTATATPKVREDIISSLRMNNVKVFQKSYFRSNLILKVEERGSKSNFNKRLLQIIATHSGTSGIIYCSSRKRCEEISEYLNSCSIIAKPYHAGFSTKIRHQVQESWKSNKVQVICATIAFGMGVDKSDTRWVIHANLPKSMLDYYQEIGRAGRDGKTAYCYLLYSYSDKIVSHQMIIKKENKKNAGFIGNLLGNLHDMTYYAASEEICRHRQVCASLGEKMMTDCKTSCDICLNSKNMISVDITEQALIIFDKLKDFPFSRSQIRSRVSGVSEKVLVFLVLEKYLKENVVPNDKGYFYQQLKMCKKCIPVLEGKKQILMKQLLKSKDKKLTSSKSIPIITSNFSINQDMYDELKEYRRLMARELKVPAYRIMTNAVLEGISSTKPKCESDFLALKGVGKKTVEKHWEKVRSIVEKYE